MNPVAALIHVPGVQLGLLWYQKAFLMAKVNYLKEFDFTVLDINGFSLEIVQADDKVSAGKSGVILYWSVDSLNATMKHFDAMGTRLYRGPLNIENGLLMCQLEDPFGNLIGLRGCK